MPRKLIIASATASIPLLAFLDYLTGYEINFFIFYFAPVAAFAWYAGRTHGFLAALACAIIWFVVDGLSGRTYAHVWVGAWNGAIRLLAFLLTALAVARIRKDRVDMTALNVRLANNVLELERSLSRIRELQGEIQLVCAWTKRIKSEGRWMQFEEFMERSLKLRFTHGISEEAAAKLEAELSQAEFDDETEPPAPEREI